MIKICEQSIRDCVKHIERVRETEGFKTFGEAAARVVIATGNERESTFFQKGLEAGTRKGVLSGIVIGLGVASATYLAGKAIKGLMKKEDPDGEKE